MIETSSNATSVNSEESLVSANGVFNIVVVYSGDPRYQAAFTTSVARWTQIIIADIPDFNSGTYGLIDDLLIHASIRAIDGAGGILGQAGPDVLRSGSRLPAHGIMEFNSADVEQMYVSGVWTGVIMHEIGHILGIGTNWGSLGLKNSAGDYIGARGLAEYRLLSGNAGATSVPIEKDGGSGTAGAHWDEETFNAELMTGYVESANTFMPISRMTIGSLQDLGYTVNYAAADAYSLPNTGPGPTPGPGSGVINGDGGNNVLNGTAGVDTINGLGGNDTISALGGNDTLDGGAGNDSLDGGAGDDTALFSGNLASYSLLDLGVRIMVSGLDGTDTLTGVEHLRFADGIVHVNDGSTLFDTAFYDSTYLDVFRAGVDARAHFNAHGWREGRDPNPFFSSFGYLGANAEVRASGVNPLDQFHATGWKEGRDPSANFDVRLYLINNPDVAAAGVDPLEHFLANGQAEGRASYMAIGTIVAGFDAQYYMMNNLDVARAGPNAAAHYNAYGWHEGRNPNSYFDTGGYLSHYTDVAAAGVNPLQHYMQYGWKEGRDASLAFDTAKYLAANADVAAAGLNPLEHFLQYGIYEGRAAFADTSW